MNFVDCCRLCLKNLADVLLDEDGHFTIAYDRNLQRMIFECFQILVSDGEIVSKVCSRCHDQIHIVNKIRKRIRKADFEIKQYYASLIIKQEDDFLEEVSDHSGTHANEDTELHQTDNQQLDQEPEFSEILEDDDTISKDNFINEYDHTEGEPQFDYDGASMERNSSESQSESEHSHASIKRHKKTTPKKVGRKVDCKCYICETDFDTVEALDNHIAAHVGSTGQVCNLCQLPVSTVRYLNMHLRRFHFRKGKRIPCEECKKNNIVREFSSNFKLQAHIKMVHEGIVEIQEKKFICTYCGKSFARGTHLRMHENNIHTKAILYKCDQCSFAATSRSGLIRHIRIHTAEKPFKCDECDASFNQSSSLHAHKNGKHSNERPFSCNICGDEKRFKTKYTLQTHMRCHQLPGVTTTRANTTNGYSQQKITAMGTEITVVERELKCNFCPAVYSWEKYLCRHIVEKHPTENVTMLSCELCQEMNKKEYFLTQSEKDRHIDKHDKLNKMPIKEWVCPDCGEVYQTSDSFHRHRESHIKHVCKDCGKSFATRKTLRRHVVTVHLKSRPYKCDKCDSSFGQLTSLTTHMKVHQRLHKSKQRSTNI